MVSSDSTDTTSSEDSSDDDDDGKSKRVNTKGSQSQQSMQNSLQHKSAAAIQKCAPTTSTSHSAKTLKSVLGVQPGSFGGRVSIQDSSSTSDDSSDDDLGLLGRVQCQQGSQNSHHVPLSIMLAQAAKASHTAKPTKPMLAIQPVIHSNPSSDENDDGRRYFQSHRKGKKKVESVPMIRSSPERTSTASTSHSVKRVKSVDSINIVQIRDSTSDESSEGDDDGQSPQCQQRVGEIFQRMPIQQATSETSNPIPIASANSSEAGKCGEADPETKSSSLGDWVPIQDGYLDLLIHLQKEQDLCEVDRVVKFILEQNIRVIHIWVFGVH